MIHLPAWSGFYLFLQQVPIVSLPFSFSYSPCPLLPYRTFLLCPSLHPSPWVTPIPPCLTIPAMSYSLSCILHFQPLNLFKQFLSFHSTASQSRKGLHLLLVFKHPRTKRVPRTRWKSCLLSKRVNDQTRTSEPLGCPAVVRDLKREWKKNVSSHLGCCFSTTLIFPSMRKMVSYDYFVFQHSSPI